MKQIRNRTKMIPIMYTKLIQYFDITYANFISTTLEEMSQINQYNNVLDIIHVHSHTFTL